MEQVLSVFAEKFMLSLVVLFAPLAAKWAVELVFRLRDEIRAKNPDTFYYLGEVARIAVRAAEQAKVANLITEKKAYALEFAEKLLSAQGITIDLDVISAAIEAAVYTEFNRARADAAANE